MVNNINIIPKSFYQGDDVVKIAKQLIGKTLVTHLDGQLCKGKIVETEAYRGWGDKACHASEGKRTPRTETMYLAGGCAYVYLCYGIHHLFNVVTNVAGKADAVLIRAIEPIEGMDSMVARTNHQTKVSNGPGKLCKAMGIDMRLNKKELNSELLWIEDAKAVELKDLVISTRVGVGYAGEDALLPWRFYLKDNDWVSKL
ncbi:DNA-3-methyladenine glycosylase [Reichenbachiella agarivorans]|uniref:Putative 3-methyladenine DNA glycosylase n=1 Tax=Reichenbachiella agarivorans TaxID=2979464 RepID=A0ABY6CMJ6_9BACT|nr:DNA-3-methyladenine glycosylase [Reichenbachiella agarivorans]UXP31731.1 DNA-3-methyladenine glycosylase [Reichenbachiella agarivorans]